MQLKWGLRFLWLLLPLVFTADDWRYDYQVVVLLEKEKGVIKASSYLFEKHKTVSYGTLWENDKFVDTSSKRPIPEDIDWSRAKVRVVGHGNVEGDLISGFSAEELARAISEKLANSEGIGKISIVACSEPGTRPPSNEPPYLREFMDELKTLGKVNTEVSMSSALVGVDRDGRKLTGERVQDEDIIWSHKNPSHKWTGNFEGESDNPTIRRGYVTEDAAGATPDLPPDNFGILPRDYEAFVAEITSKHNNMRLNNEDAYRWVDGFADNIYHSQQGRAPDVPHEVQLKGQGRPPEIKKIKEIGSINDLLKELRYYGETGKATKPSEVYYRFGDIIVSMNEQDFYVSAEGVILDKGDSETTRKTKEAIVQRLTNDPLPESYSKMQPRTSGMLGDVQNWINGDNDIIGLNEHNLYNAQCGLAMFLSESIRCFPNHISNMMSLDLRGIGSINDRTFFDSHPMARGGSWIDDRTGLDMLREADRENPEAREISERISGVTRSWLSRIESGSLLGTENMPASGQLVAVDHSTLSSLTDIAELPPGSKKYTRQFDPNEPATTSITDPELQSVDTQIDEFSRTADTLSTHQASVDFARDQVYVSELINDEIEQKERELGKELEVLPDSMTLDEDSDTVRFLVHEKLNPSETEEISTTIDKSELYSKEMVDGLDAKASEASEKPSSFRENTAKVNQGLAIYGIVQGLSGGLNALETGNVTQGVIGLTMSLHGIGEMSGFNKKVYQTTGNYLGKVLRGQLEVAGDTVTTIAGQDAGAVFKSVGGGVLSTAGDIGDLLEDVPIVGTAFGIYSIVEDFKQQSTMGYIDGSLDIAITGLSLLGPETEPLVVALTIIRMGIDTFYRDISKELDALPPSASIGDQVTAVFKGIGNAMKDLAIQLTLPGQIYGAVTNSKKLNEQYDNDREFLSNLSDYNNYFAVVKEEGGGPSEINFAGGSESWNGGDITFHLSESGQSPLTLEAVDSDGNLVTETHYIDTDGVEDIVMGIGESHSISFKKQTVKVFWFIPVDSKTLISDTHGEKETLHGT